MSEPVEYREPRFLKVCSSCGWAGYTCLNFCHRKTHHAESVPLTLVPKADEKTILESTVVVRI